MEGDLASRRAGVIEESGDAQRAQRETQNGGSVCAVRCAYLDKIYGLANVSMLLAQIANGFKSRVIMIETIHELNEYVV
jgi:hypothetical protein